MSSTNSAAAAAATSQRRFGLNFGLRDAGTLFGLLAIVVVFAVLSPNFLTERNLLNILQQSSINACVALGMTLVIIAGGIDLSVGPTAAIAAVVAAVLMAAGAPIVVAIPVALLFGVAAGALNGVLVAYGGLQPFIVTLGTLVALPRYCPDLHRRQPDLRHPAGVPRPVQLVHLRRSEPGRDRRRSRARGLGGAQQDAARRILPRRRRQRRRRRTSPACRSP